MRQTAKKCRIGHLLSGNYVQKEGWDPNYFETDVGKISRVNLIAIVVSKENNTLLLDDGSGKISLRSFEGPGLDFEVGDKVLVIGRPRMYNDEPYIAAEIVKKVENEKWLEHRQIEIKTFKEIKQPKIVVEKAEATTESKKELRTSEGVIEKIKKLDSGNGADVEKIIKNVKDGEKILGVLLEEGEVFEIKPGRVKVLE